ncbi:Nif3-like dinuclear metal center hexameric protein [Niveibacterium sp. SC-1]|uniref:Nif3-like dinuclear metal center hexameric protein n=1 Tax=Niveibacterium sp. SC-1 TaxID=3135646 RepID=UPI00311DFEAF
MHRSELQRTLDELLNAARVKDYCPNGLQVEGRAEVSHVLCGVTASLALVEAAIERGADALLVHHGYFWRGEDPRVIGTRKQRLAKLLAHDINLYAYHLPLDLHPELGNNAQLARVMGWREEGRFGEQDLGSIGVCESGTAAQVARSVAARLGREPQLVGNASRPVRRIAWCTGAAQSMLQAAIDAGADLFVSGEISEPTVHLARESGVPYIAAGHHATERYGVHALARHLADAHGLRCDFLDLDNPV